MLTMFKTCDLNLMYIQNGILDVVERSMENYATWQKNTY